MHNSFRFMETNVVKNAIPHFYYYHISCNHSMKVTGSSIEQLFVFYCFLTKVFYCRKIPGGVFGRDGEMELFAAVELPADQQVDAIRRLVLKSKV